MAARFTIKLFRSLLVFLTLYFPVVAMAQHDQLAELQAALSGATSDSVKVRVHNQLSQYFFATDVEKGFTHATYALKLAEEQNFTRGKIKASLLLAKGHLILGQFDRGLVRTLHALNYAEQIQDSVHVMAAHNLLGSFYVKLHENNTAIKHYAEAEKFAKRLGDRNMHGKILNNLGNLYESDKAYTKALVFFKKAARIQEKTGDKYSLAISLHNIGNQHLQLPEPEAGLPYLVESLRLNESIKNTMLRPTTLESIARIYQATGKEKLALQFADQSFKAALSTGSSKKISSSSNLLQELYALKGDYKKAYEYMEIMAKHEALLDNESQQKAAMEITAHHDAEQKKIAFHKLEAEKEKQELLIRHQRVIMVLGGALFLMLLASLIVLFYSRKRIHLNNNHLLDANQKMQAQHIRISNQRDEILSQATLLRQQNEELEKNGHFKNRLFSIISHDLRAPFHSLRGILKLTQKNTMTDVQIKHIFSLLEKETETAGNMLNNILVWSKAQLDSSHVNLEPVNLRQIAEDNLSQIESQAAEKNINLVNAVDEDIVAIADKERLHFVIRNLLSNALKFTFRGGEIRLSNSTLDGKVTFAVTDNGKGISAKGLQKLFTEERYTTLGTLQEKGTGLGLLLIKEFMDSMHGSITVASEEGAGTVFTLLLPTAAVKSDEPIQLESISCSG